MKKIELIKHVLDLISSDKKLNKIITTNIQNKHTITLCNENKSIWLILTIDGENIFLQNINPKYKKINLTESECILFWHIFYNY